MLEVPEAMRWVLPCMLVASVSSVCWRGCAGECAPSLEVPKVVRCVLLCMLEVVKGSLCCRRCRR